MVFPIGTTVIEFTATDSSGNQSVCQFDVEVLDFPSQATIIPDTLFFCEQNGVVIEAVPATSGTGEWSVLNGQGVFNNQFANLTGVNNIASGINTYIWTISSASCGSTADTLVVVNSQQDIQAATQDTLYACDSGSIDLIANSPLFGSGLWTTDGGGTIQDPDSSVTTASFGNGWQDFIWTISNPGCPSTSDTLAVFGLLTPEIITPDTLVCLESDEIELSASGQAAGQIGSWSIASGSAEFSSTTPNPTTASGFYYGTTLIVYRLSHPECPDRSDTMIVSGTLCDEYEPIIPTVFTPGNLDGSNDVFTIDFLSTVYPECKVLIFNRWGSVVYESTGYEDPWDGTFKGEALPMGTYFYQIDLNDGSGKQFKGDISIIK
jgi:gliding motility-associated-like protein